MHDFLLYRTSSNEHVHPNISSNVGPKGRPQLVVIGFDVGGQSNDLEMEECETPPCVPEQETRCNSVHSDQTRSPRSVLGSLLAKQKVDASYGDQEEQDEVVRKDEMQLKVPPLLHESNSKALISTLAAESEKVCPSMSDFNLESGNSADSIYNYGVDVSHGNEKDLPQSIFCAASPYSTCCSLDLSGCHFLSLCFFCKCSLTNGKDVYMYKGNKAFCSVECRYQQIVLDEFRERQTASAGCFVQPLNQTTKMYGGASTATA
ncbi:hypothetical protein KP509_13G011100 [Ceratopteris richardii]|uniref:FLZ-type domain-containing protein n=1 Tax=Ceratopteris richardii TaxID=49495 RepID=A0A8T2TFA8_CERRI|nr:hypothetical protein KP509_13G011100 [Ceratopteris richardii]